MVKNGVGVNNQTGFQLNWYDHIGENDRDSGVHGFGCNFKMWNSVSYVTPTPIISTTILEQFPKLYASIKLTDAVGIVGTESYDFGIRYVAYWDDLTHSGVDSFVNSGIVTWNSIRTITAGWWATNEYMVDFGPDVADQYKDIFQIWAVCLTGTFTSISSSGTHDIVYTLLLSNCNMWLTR